MSADPSLQAPADVQVPTLVGAGASFQGLLTFRGAARVDGELLGRIHAQGRLVIGPRARVRAHVEVDEVVVAGELEGEIHARQRAEILASGRVSGSLQALRIQVADGGLLQAQLQMEPRGAQPAESPPEPSASS